MDANNKAQKLSLNQRELFLAAHVYLGTTDSPFQEFQNKVGPVSAAVIHVEVAFAGTWLESRALIHISNLQRLAYIIQSYQLPFLNVCITQRLTLSSFTFSYRGSNSGRDRFIFLFHCVRSGFVVQAVTCLMRTRVKWLEREANHSPQSPIYQRREMGSK